MKKLAALVSSLTYLLTSTVVLAVDDPSRIVINRPKLEDKNVGFSTLGDALNKLLVLSFVIAIMAVLIMLIWGALQWIFSGGSKEALESARNRILHALIGLAILAVAFALFVLAGQFTGLNATNFVIPTPAP